IQHLTKLYIIFFYSICYITVIIWNFTSFLRLKNLYTLFLRFDVLLHPPAHLILYKYHDPLLFSFSIFSNSPSNPSLFLKLLHIFSCFLLKWVISFHYFFSGL